MDPHNLLTVAAALNIQAQRDLAPVWNTRVIVSPFLSLDDVPPGYGMIVILPRGHGLPGPKGFHFVQSDVAVAVVEDADDWSLYASHELMEMLVDMRGDRTTRAPSLEPSQGWVDYLVEVCDPCEHSTYTIDGVLVSDFVTPAYYTGAPAGTDTLYSITGRVTAPRQLLQGGYITWATQPPNAQVWQAVAPAGSSAVPEVAKSVEKGPVSPGRFERNWIDTHPTTRADGLERPVTSSKRAGDQPLSSARDAYQDAARDAQLNGSQARRLITDIMRAEAKVFPKDKARQLLTDLADEAERAKFLANPKGRLKELTGEPVPRFDAPKTLPSPERYQEALSIFDDANRFGTPLFDSDLPGLCTWMCQLGGF